MPDKNEKTTVEEYSKGGTPAEAITAEMKLCKFWKRYFTIDRIANH